MSEPIVLSVEDLRVEYRVARSSVSSLRGVELDLRAGEVLGVVGESGSGKSTLVAAVMGLLPGNATIRSGRIGIAGTDMVTADPETRRSLRRRELGMIPQNPITSLDPTRRVRTAFHDVEADEHLARRLLASVGFADVDAVLGSYPHQLSGGMAQRVAIALAIARNPPVLVADEPTSALDADVADSVLAILVDQARRERRGLLVVTHDLSIVSTYCDRVAVMNRGEIVEAGDVAEVLRSPRDTYTRLLLSASRTLHAEERPRRTVATDAAIELRDTSVSFASGPPWASTRAAARRSTGASSAISASSRSASPICC